MIQYIYFVKCPNCADEHFDFFEEAKAFALGCLNNKPIITQVEVNRNDFGECVDSADLGTVWSWEEVMKGTETAPEETKFSKAATLEYHPEEDDEFNFDDDFDTSDVLRKPVPEGMTIEELVEAMEENEDIVECGLCEELFDKSECRYELNLGWLCKDCQADLISRGESPVFKENTYWDFLDESAATTEPIKESASSHDYVDLEYPSLTITVYGNKRDADDWDEREHSDSYTYTVSKDDVATAIWENFMTDADVADIPGGMEALEDDEVWEQFLETHFDGLFEKYYDKLLQYFEDAATEAFEEETAWSDLYSEGYTPRKAILEELEDAEAYSKRLTVCPECDTISFDPATGICINCGFN